MADLQYQASLDDKAVLQGLKNIEREMKRVQQEQIRATRQQISEHRKVLSLTKKLDKDLAGASPFKSMGKDAAASGIQIGLISGIVSSLTTEFINLGKQAVGALVGIAQEGTQVALEFDTLRSRLLGIFDGSKPAAEEAFNFIQEKSKELGINLSEVAGAFLPKVESLAQFERVAKIATALARSDPEQGAIGARIALIEALSGTFTSLQRRFEIPKDDIKAIKAAFDTGGMEGFITKLEEVLAESGKSFDDLANTAQTSIDKVNIQFEQLKGALGVPIVEELKEQFNALFDTLEDDKFVEIATTIGQIVAEVLDFMSSGFVQELREVDPQGFIDLAGAIFELLGNIQLLADTVFNLPDDFSAINAAVQGLTDFVNFINIELRGWSIAIALAKGGIDAIVATAPKLVGIVQALSALGKAAQGNLVAAALEAKEAADNLQSSTLFDPEAGKAALKNTLQEISDALKEVDEGSAASKEKLQALLDSLGEVGQTGAADEFLGIAAAERDLAAAAEDAAAAQKKIDEAKAKIETDFQSDLLEADIKFERARTDALLDGQRKREDAARKNLQKIADIEKKNQQAITDSGTDLDRDLIDISTKHSRQKIEQRKDEAQKIIDLETDTRRKIKDIIDTSQVDLDEAESRRDAVSFLRILKQRNLDISTAQQDTARAVQDTRLEGQRKREELKIQQEQEIQDEKLANDRRLQDLQTSLDRELEAQATAFARERDEIAINEAQKLEDLITARTRDREDALRHYNEKLEDLQTALAAELALIEEFAAKKAAAEAEAEASAKSFKKPSKTGGKAAGFGATPDTLGKPKSTPFKPAKKTALGTPFAGFQHGGSFSVGGSGGADSQLVQFMATPGERVMISPRTPANNVSNFNNQRTVSVNQSMLDPSHQSAIMRAIARQEALNLINELN